MFICCWFFFSIWLIVVTINKIMFCVPVRYSFVRYIAVHHADFSLSYNSYNSLTVFFISLLYFMSEISWETWTKFRFKEMLDVFSMFVKFEFSVLHSNELSAYFATDTYSSFNSCPLFTYLPFVFLWNYSERKKKHRTEMLAHQKLQEQQMKRKRKIINYEAICWISIGFFWFISMGHVEATIIIALCCFAHIHFSRTFGNLLAHLR